MTNTSGYIVNPATVTNVQRFSLHDGGGIRTVVFLKGCPFRCPWCCNPENLSAEPEVSLKERLCMHCSPRPGGAPCATAPEDCPTGAKELLGRTRTVDDLVAEVARDGAFFEESGGGVTVSGGECLLRQDFLLAFLEACRAEGLSTAVETTLALPLEDPARLVAACDVLLVDFKIADRARSLEVTGIDPELRDANLRTVLGLGARVVARMPIIPGFTDDDACVAANVARIRELGLSRVDVLPFHQLGQGKYDATGRDYALRDVPQLSDADVEGVVARCEAAGLATVVHGE
ncbi:radical SAM protein [Thermophilibacter sp. ET337]|uniref:radical SAM protein n=1 Tax=Thermophilibacter sp. ET337 TaxID=2973084 RepID=UPI0021ACD085|nr:radical SAM protein [Thermophilibacter sp. ET337]MCR8908412.1 radical SAM protein [Thermophilibacter sp. ET337]